MDKGERQQRVRDAILQALAMVLPNADLSELGTFSYRTEFNAKLNANGKVEISGLALWRSKVKEKEGLEAPLIVTLPAWAPEQAQESE